MKKIEKITPLTDDDFIRAQNKIIDTLRFGIALREQVIEKQRELIEILKKEVKRKKWWKIW
jgi:hypothetical protein